MTSLALDETTGVPWVKKCPRDRDNGPGAWHRSGNSDATRTLSRVPAASHSPFGAVQESNRRSSMSTIADMYAVIADDLAEILAHGEIDDYSRNALAARCRMLNEFSARRTEQPTLTAPTEMSDRQFHDSYSRHIGSIYVLYNLDVVTHALQRALSRGRLAWLDDIDAMTDKQLLAARGFGAKTVAVLRSALDLYYWRSPDHEANRATWEDIAERYARDVEYKFHTPTGARRCRAGLEFARRVLAEDGAPLADPRTVRMVSV